MINHSIFRDVQKPILLPENCWYVSRHADVKLLFEEENSSKDFLKWVDIDNAPKGWSESFRLKQLLLKESGKAAETGFGMFDNPEHNNHLTLFMPLFSVKNMERISSDICSVVEKIVDENINNNFNLASDLGKKVFQTFISSFLEITEVSSDIESWADHVQSIINYSLNPEWLNPYSEETLTRFQKAIDYFIELNTSIIIDRIVNPKDDIICKMLKDFDNDYNMVGLYMTYLSTLGMSLGYATISLLMFLSNNKDLQNELRTKGTLTHENIEELLRVSNEKPLLIRVLRKDVIIDGIVMKKGMIVLLDLTATERDPEVYADPYSIDLDRKFVNNLMWGYSMHACSGRVMGRTIVRKSIETILSKTTDLNIVGEITSKFNGSLPVYSNIPFRLENTNV